MIKEIDYKKLFDIEYVKNNKTIREISKEIKRSPHTIAKKFNELGLEVRNKRIDYSNANFNFFDTWSVEMAYWLGFIAADGSISGNTVSIALKDIDRRHLEKLKIILNLPDRCLKDRKIYHKKTDKEFNQSYLMFTSNHVVEIFKKHGIVDSKSNMDINFLSNIKEKYKLAFIFGYFDGDGSISINLDKNLDKNLKKINFVGNNLFINELKFFLVDKLDFNNSKIFNISEKISSVTWSSYKDVFNFIEQYISLLGNSIPLDRKLLIMKTNLKKLKKKQMTYLNSHKGIEDYRIKNWPSKEDLENLIQDYSFMSIGRKYV